MPYTTLEKIKRRLQIASTDSSIDALLNDILSAVDAEINFMLRQRVRLPIEDPLALALLDDIEADWAAGRYRALVEPATLMTPEGEFREHVFVTDAKRRLRALIDNLAGFGVTKV